MTEDMGKLDYITQVLLKKLMESLGDNFNSYMEQMRNWFKMKGSRSQLDAEFEKILTPQQFHFHTQLLIHLIDKCKIPPVLSNFNQNIYKDGFEPIDPTLYVVTERKELTEAEPPPMLIHERLLPNQSSTLARLMYCAWELGLEGSDTNAAEYLTIATHHFLKNIITSVICRKKGYKCRYNGFIHSLGTATPNPWLRNVAKYQSDKSNSFKYDSELNSLNGLRNHAEQKTKEDLEYDNLFRLSASNDEKKIGPISLYDLSVTLQMYPSLISSNFVRVATFERIYARLSHPVIED